MAEPVRDPERHPAIAELKQRLAQIDTRLQERLDAILEGIRARRIKELRQELEQASPKQHTS